MLLSYGSLNKKCHLFMSKLYCFNCCYDDVLIPCKFSGLGIVKWKQNIKTTKNEINEDYKGT